MKRIIIVLVMIVGSLGAKAQFPTTDSLKAFVNRWIRNSAVEAFQNLRLNTALIGISNFIDSSYGGQVKSFTAPNDSTARLITIANDTFDVIIRGNPPSLTLTNVGTGYALVTTPNGSIKRLSPSYGVLMDSTTTANSITITADTVSTNHVITQSDLNDAIAGASGATNLDTARTGSTVTITSSTGNDAVILGASAEKAGTVTTSTQYFEGRKNILGKTSNFNGYGPRLNTQLLVPAKEADSIYAASRYRGFGFCGVFKSGVRVMVFVDGDNHVGHHSIVMLGKSYDQGRTYSIDTLLAGLPDTCITMGGGGIGPDNRLIIFYKRFLNADLSPVDQRMVVSDDEGETLYNNQVIGHGSNTEYLPYGGLVHCADDVLLLPWYGQNGSTFSSYVIRSTDGGLTWGSAITAFSNTTSQRTETSFEHLGGGTIIGLMRSEVGDTLYGQVISYDNGATWAYQGQVAFGINGTPAWLSAFRSQNGKMAVACYYRVGTELRAKYAFADSVILGPSHWDSREDVLATGVNGSGYLNVCHPYQSMEGFGFFYSETVAQTNATIKWVKVPLGGGFPIGVGTGVSGLTTGRIPVASSATSLTDYSTLKYNTTSTSIVTTNTTPQDWADHNGGVIESSKNAIVLSENGYIGMHDNAYINSDYRYKVSGAAAGLFNLTAGRLHFYNVGSGTAGNVISWTERLRIGTAGDYYFNGSAGTAGQVLVSGGAGSPSAWTTYVPSQWADVTGGINYAGDKVGIRSATPRAPLDVIGGTSGSGNHTVIFEDDNSAIGMSMLLGYTSATGTNQRFKGFVMDNNGLNIVKALNNLSGVPTSIATFTQADNFAIGTTTFNGYKLQVEGAISTVTDSAGSPKNMAWIDTDGKIRKAAVPSGSSYSFTNGLTESGGTAKLGAALTENTTISSSNASYRLNITGVNTGQPGMLNSTTTGNGGVAITGTASGTSAYGVHGVATGTGGRAIMASATDGTGVFSSSTGVAFHGESVSGKGIEITSSFSATNALSIVNSYAVQSAGTAANGFGGINDFYAEMSNGSNDTAARITWEWTNATAGSQTGALKFWTKNNAGNIANRFQIAGDGKLTASAYGAGSFNGTPTASLQTTSSGDIIEGPALAAGTFTPTLTAVTNTSSPLLDGARYTRIGNIVTFSMRFSVTTSSGSSASSIRVTLPVGSSFSNVNNAAGTNSGSLGYVEADATNDELTISWISGTGGSETIVVTGQYTIL